MSSDLRRYERMNGRHNAMSAFCFSWCLFVFFGGFMVEGLTVVTKSKGAKLIHDEEQFTTLRKPNGEKIDFYSDGYEGITYRQIIGILQFLEVDYFEIHKNLRR